jgi:hypothetical protein
MLLTFLGLLTRIGVFISSIITIGLNARFYTNNAWSDDLIIYIIAISSFGAVACLVPPYPNFLWDLFWALGALLAAVFALVVQVRSFPTPFKEEEDLAGIFLGKWKY